MAEGNTNPKIQLHIIIVIPTGQNSLRVLPIFIAIFQHSREGGGFMEEVIMGIIKLVEIIAGQIFKDGQNK